MAGIQAVQLIAAVTSLEEGEGPVTVGTTRTLSITAGEPIFFRFSPVSEFIRGCWSMRINRWWLAGGCFRASDDGWAERTEVPSAMELEGMGNGHGCQLREEDEEADLASVVFLNRTWFRPVRFKTGLVQDWFKPNQFGFKPKLTWSSAKVTKHWPIY